VNGSSQVSIGEIPQNLRLDPDARGAGAAVLAQFGRFGYRSEGRSGETTCAGAAIDPPFDLEFDFVLALETALS
jgi:hypothetical protein